MYYILYGYTLKTETCIDVIVVVISGTGGLYAASDDEFGIVTIFNFQWTWIYYNESGTHIPLFKASLSCVRFRAICHANVLLYRMQIICFNNSTQPHRPFCFDLFDKSNMIFATNKKILKRIAIPACMEVDFREMIYIYIYNAKDLARHLYVLNVYWMVGAVSLTMRTGKW